MRFGAAFWMQQTDWPSLRDACLAAEAAGFNSLWLDDHLLSDEGDWRASKFEGWTSLAALAALTTRPTLGLLVAANTLRNPGLTAKMAATIDNVSGGRFILGIGGGWFEREHEAFGFDFGAGFGERLDRLEEAVGLIERLLAGEMVTHEGRFYRFVDALCRPLPVQARVPILIGGSGRKKTLRTTALHADLWNGFGEPDRIAETSEVLRERCAEVGRDFEAIRRTVTMDVSIRGTAAEARASYRAMEDGQGIEQARVGSDDTERGLNVGGPPEAVADYLRAFEALGIAEVIWVFRSPFDLETMSRLPRCAPSSRDRERARVTASATSCAPPRTKAASRTEMSHMHARGALEQVLPRNWGRGGQFRAEPPGFRAQSNCRRRKLPVSEPRISL